MSVQVDSTSLFGACPDCCVVSVLAPKKPRLKARVCGRSLAGPAVSKHAEGMDVSLVSDECWHEEVSATGWSLVQRSLTVCACACACACVCVCVSECESECVRHASTTTITWPNGGCSAMKKIIN